MFFGKKTFNQLIEMLVSTPNNAYHGCEINMPDTAIFKDGKTTKFVKTNKEGFLISTAQQLNSVRFCQSMSQSVGDRERLILRKKREYRKR